MSTTKQSIVEASGANDRDNGMDRAQCRGCLGEQLTQIIDLGDVPLAGGFLADRSAIASEKLYPLSAHVCDRCGLVQIVRPVEPAILFKDYAFSSSTVGPLVDHFEAYAGWLADELKPKTVVEIGCNDGVLLAPLQKRGVRAVGVDLAENITEMAREKGLDVVTGYFDVETADEIRERVGPADVVTGSNCFAHNENPQAILEAAKRLLAPDGALCLEVMYAGDLLAQLQWDTLYHEHLTFYSLGTLSRLLERFGLHVSHAERLPMHGGSLRVVAGLESVVRSQSFEEVQKLEDSLRLNDAKTWTDFGKKCRRTINIVSDVVGPLAGQNRIWAYGAAGKATMWLNACGMTYLETMVDASPLRAGKLMPGVHTPIVLPEELKRNPPDYVFITAWNYADVIAAKESWFEGTWLTPLPELRFF